MGSLRAFFGSDFRLNTPPATPTTGDAVIVGLAPEGAFVDHEDEYAEFDSSNWIINPVPEGSTFYDLQKRTTRRRTPTGGWRKLDPFSRFWAGLATDYNPITTTPTVLAAWSTPVVEDGSTTDDWGWDFNATTGVLTALEDMPAANVGATVKCEFAGAPAGIDMHVTIRKNGTIVPNTQVSVAVNSATIIPTATVTVSAEVVGVDAGDEFTIYISKVNGSGTLKVEADGTAFYATELPGDMP